MKIILKSEVIGDLTTVYDRFDDKLFRYLLPPGATLIEFGGSTKGDIVHLKLPLAGEWISEITENGMSPDMRYFIDEGRKLPFPLKKWKHKHILLAAGKKTIIEDNMTFSSGNIIIDLFIYPVLLLSFLPRIWQYKQYFRSN
jgi:ligand-binding SRPBCC domain-containing protein|tara:strand:- start:1070 stop:1495 length:426 start_codon:yes stop_codon:yes gene_type:complete